MSRTSISMGEVKKMLNYTIDNNIRLQEERGKMPIAVCLEAEAGIGKTSILQQIAAERGMTCTKLSLHTLDEAGDLLGWPQQEYECQVMKRVLGDDGKPVGKILPGTVWVNAKQLESKDENTRYKQTGKTRMSYAKPAWVPEYNENGNLFILDDYGRCNQALQQAIMEFVLTQSYTSWTLPKKTSIFLTSNPDNGDYNVNTQDLAQKTRYLTYDVDFSVEAWAQWAEKDGIDGRCINFVLSYSDQLFKTDREGNAICNPRSFVMFADMISGIDDWDKVENLDMITTIAKGCFKDDKGRFSTMFLTFLRNKMHQLIQPKEMLTGDWDKTREKLFDTLYDKDGNYRPDISTMLERRFTNYINAWLDSDAKTPISKVKERLVNIIECSEKYGKKIFGEDSFYRMLKSITQEHKRQTGQLILEPKIAKYITQ